MADLNRRWLFQAGALTGASLFLRPGTAQAAPASTTTLGRSRFAAQLGRKFTLTRAGRNWSATLGTIADLQPVLQVGDERRFSLRFDTTDAGPDEGVVTLSRPGFGDAELFLVPDASRRHHTAIVNRL